MLTTYITPGPVRYSFKNVMALMFMLLCITLSVYCFADIKNHAGDTNIQHFLIYLGCNMILGAVISIPFIKKDAPSW